MPAADVHELKQTIATEFGKSCDELFTFFDENPLGTASIAQVSKRAWCFEMSYFHVYHRSVCVQCFCVRLDSSRY